MAWYEREKDGDTEVWVVEARGAATFERRAKNDNKGSAKLRGTFKTEAAALRSLEKFRDKMLDKGWSLLDPGAGVDARAPKGRPAPTRAKTKRTSIDLDELADKFTELQEQSQSARPPRALRQSIGDFLGAVSVTVEGADRLAAFRDFEHADGEVLALLSLQVLTEDDRTVGVCFVTGSDGDISQDNRCAYAASSWFACVSEFRKKLDEDDFLGPMADEPVRVVRLEFDV